MQTTREVSSQHGEPELCSSWQKQVGETDGRNTFPNTAAFAERRLDSHGPFEPIKS